MDYQTGLWEKYLVTGDWSQSNQPAFVAQSDAHPTGDQEVEGPIHVVHQDSFMQMIMKYFLQSFSPFHWFKKDGNFCQFLAKEWAQILGNHLGD